MGGRKYAIVGPAELSAKGSPARVKNKSYATVEYIYDELCQVFELPLQEAKISVASTYMAVSTECSNILGW